MLVFDSVMVPPVTCSNPGRGLRCADAERTNLVSSALSIRSAAGADSLVLCVPGAGGCLLAERDF